MATSCPQWCAVPGDQRQRATSWEGGWAWTLGGRGARWYPPRWHARWVELFRTVSDWQDGIAQVTRTRSCLGTSHQRTWCTSSCSYQTTGTLRAFGWTVGKSRIQWKQSSHSDRNLKMIHFFVNEDLNRSFQLDNQNPNFFLYRNLTNLSLFDWNLF